MENWSKEQIIDAYLGKNSEQRPLLGDFYDRINFTQEELIAILSSFNREATDERHPMLDLSRQNLKSIPREIALVKGPAAEIEIDGKKISYREIDLSHNKLITQLSSDDFKALNHFSGIHFIGLRLEKIPPECALLTNPIVLNFSWSDLKELPEEIYQLTQLIDLRLNWTSISNFSEKIINLKKLKSIEMSETPFLSVVYKIRETGSAVTEKEQQVQKIIQILDNLGCIIEE